MIGDQIKAATLLGAYVEHRVHPLEEYGPLGAPELNIVCPTTAGDRRLSITPLPADMSALIDFVAEECISYGEDRELVCAAVTEDLKAKVDRLSYLLTALEIRDREWFRVLPGRPLTSYVGCHPDRTFVEVATSQHLPGPWMPLSTAMFLPLAVNVADLLQGLHVCARYSTHEDDHVGAKNWGHDYHSWNALLSSLWEDHKWHRPGDPGHMAPA